MATLANQGIASQASFGQHGSAFIDNIAAYTPPSGKVVVAITLTADTVFNVLRQEAFTLGDVGTTAQKAAAALTVGFFGGHGTDATYSGGGIGDIVASNVFPKGLTIYGRWDSVDLISGSCIMYFGPAT